MYLTLFLSILCLWSSISYKQIILDDFVNAFDYIDVRGNT